MTHFATSLRALRRSLAGIAAGAALLIPATGQADMRSDTLAALQAHYSSVPTMQGEFLQFGPRGEESSGTFKIKRPGKVRFDYEAPSPIEVVSNGLAVMVVNNKLKTFDTYPLKNTPLKLLLDDKFKFDEKTVIDVQSNEEVTTVVLGDKQIFGASLITLMFEPESFELRQWTIKDAQGKETSVEVKGRDLVAGLPKTVTVTSSEVREAMLDPLNTIVDSVRVTLERCPPELSADLVDRGIVLAGGGALLRGLDQLLMEETGLPVHVAEDPLSAVAEGTGKVLEELAFLKKVSNQRS